jgi:germination protein M
VTRVARVLVVAVLGITLAGCGTTRTVTRTTATPAPRFTQVRVYFLVHDKVQPISRFVSTSEPAWLGAWKNLAAGPTAETPLQATTTPPLWDLSRWTLGVTGENILSLTTVVLPQIALAQTVYTLTQFAPTRPVLVNGRRYTRADFEEFTPAILIESPLPQLPDQTVTRPFRMVGTANTFEATFQYELVDSAGKVIARHFVTATSGSGTRGTFDVTIPYPAGHAGSGKLVVYESSAKDGSRIHVIEIPVRLSP